jgi:hypothetical protein
MAEQVRPGPVGGVMPGAQDLAGSTGASAISSPAPFVSQVPGTPVHFPHFSGRPVSWVAVSLIIAGFLIGGLSLVFGPTWWLFWASLGLAAVGGLLALATGITDDWY